MELDEMLDIKAIGLAIILSGIFIIMVWKIPTWESFSFGGKIMISILLPIISYFIILYAINQ